MHETSFSQSAESSAPEILSKQREAIYNLVETSENKKARAHTHTHAHTKKNAPAPVCTTCDV